VPQTNSDKDHDIKHEYIELGYKPQMIYEDEFKWETELGKDKISKFKEHY
jgi:hypothetical protein